MSAQATQPPLPYPSFLYRWSVLLFISLAMFGNYYLYDALAPVADLLKDQLGFTEAEYGRLAGIYSWGAIGFLLIGGILVDRLGTKKSTMIFGVICAISGFVMVATDDYWVMAVSRILLGLGAEPLIVAVSAAVAKWFKGKELSFAFGINLTLARLGQVAADWSPTWAAGAYETWRAPLVIAAFIGLSCVLGAALYWILESRAEGRYELGETGATDKLVFSEIFRFHRAFWYITALCVAFYSVVFPFRSFAIKFFIEAENMSRADAGQLNSVLPIAAMFATPLFGLLVDRVGRRASLMTLGATLLVPVFLVMAYAPSDWRIAIDLPFVDPIVVPVWTLLATAALGISFSLVPAIMWPAVAYLVHQSRLGTAYALMFLLQQAAIYVVDESVGRMNQANQATAANPEGYIPMLWTFAGLGAAAVVFALLLWRQETGPEARGLETITTASAARDVQQKMAGDDPH